MKFTALAWLMMIAFTTVSAFAQPPGIRHYTERVKAPDFSLPDTTDKTHNITDYQGQVVILNFWATWCVPCKKEMPSLKKAWTRLRTEGVQLLGVAIKDDLKDVTEFKKQHSLEFPLPMDPDGSIASNWAVLAVPTAYVVDTNGRIAIRVIGGQDWNSKKLLDAIIALKHQDHPYKTVGVDY